MIHHPDASTSSHDLREATYEDLQRACLQTELENRRLKSELARLTGEREEWKRLCDEGGEVECARDREITRWEARVEQLMAKLATLRDAEARGRAAGQWQRIESAPKGRNANGTMRYVLLIGKYPTGPSMPDRVFWSDIYQDWFEDLSPLGGWARWPHSFPPTHWMPIPTPPEPPARDVQYSEANHVEE